MRLTTYAQNKLLNVMRNNNWTGFLAYVKLVKTTAPTADGTGGTEVSGGGYIRRPVGFKSPVQSGAGQIAKNAAIVYDAPSANWGDITGFYLMDAATGGNAVAYKAFPVPVSMPAGADVAFDEDTLTLTIT